MKMIDYETFELIFKLVYWSWFWPIHLIIWIYDKLNNR